jgi:hypothetical protein
VLFLWKHNQQTSGKEAAEKRNSETKALNSVQRLEYHSSFMKETQTRTAKKQVKIICSKLR